VFLATLAGWAWTWSLSAFASQEPPPEWLSWALGGLLAVKLATAFWALVRSYREGYVKWQFPLVLLSGWLAVVVCMLWLFPVWQSGGVQSALTLAVLIPLARLAACPLAMAANRHG